MHESFTSDSMSKMTPNELAELQSYYDKGLSMDLIAQERYEQEQELEVHWACGKVDCDCDEQYENWKDANED